MATKEIYSNERLGNVFANFYSYLTPRNYLTGMGMEDFILELFTVSNEYDLEDTFEVNIVVFREGTFVNEFDTETLMSKVKKYMKLTDNRLVGVFHLSKANGKYTLTQSSVA